MNDGAIQRLFDSTIEESVFTSSNFRDEGVAVDGYLSGATIFRDTNGNGQQDDGEASASTDNLGRFSIESSSAPLMLIGGWDTASKLNFSGVLSAPGNASVITPLTTLIQKISELNGGDVDAAARSVSDAFGFVGDVDLLAIDPIKGSSAGDPASLQAYAFGAEVMNTVEILSATGSQDVFAAMAALIGELASDEQLDLAGC